MSPFGEYETSGMHLTNETGMPAVVGVEASNCTVETSGAITKNKGTNINFIELNSR
tara:strand:+ start:2767 stop:2934 length:168 start_codon:yes stop_codon:yes gene_type:complete